VFSTWQRTPLSESLLCFEFVALDRRQDIFNVYHGAITPQIHWVTIIHQVSFNGSQAIDWDADTPCNSGQLFWPKRKCVT
jgi:hypothetical protein